MSDITQIVLSIFGLIGVGYVCSRLAYIGTRVGDALSEFVQKIAIPVLLARTMANADFAAISPWSTWLAYFGGVVTVWVVAHQMIRRVFGRDARAGVVAGLSTGFANTVLIGIPLVQSAYGDAGLVYVLVIVAVHLPVMLAATMALYEWGNVADGVVRPELRTPAFYVTRARRFALRLATTPIVIAIVVGFAARLADVQPVGALNLVIDNIAVVASPVALLSVGMGLSQHGMGRQLKPALIITLLKLLVMPAVVLGLAVVVGLPPLGVAVAVLTAACPTGVTAYIMAGQFGTGQALASNAVAFSTGIAVLTVTLWLLVVQSLFG